MLLSLHFILLRLRNASFPELTNRLQQHLARPYLKFIGLLGRQLPCATKTTADKIADLIMPDLFPDESPTVSDSTAISQLTATTTVHQDRQQSVKMAKADSAPQAADIRLAWEPARLQQVVWLLVHARLYVDRPVYRKTHRLAKNIILSWLNANPFPYGVHYRSAMECALRIPVFFVVLKQINGLSSREADSIMKAIYRHAWLTSKQLSLYSSLGNHTIAEAVGLVFAGAIFRSTREGRRWLGTGIRLLSDELTHQILDDGGPAEQSLAYLRFVLDLYWLAFDFIGKNNLADVQHWQPRLAAGESFLGAFRNAGGCSPSIGDSDDGCAIAPGISPAREAPMTGNGNGVTFWESGYTIVKNAQTVFFFDHGPLGMAPLYNHGHADALAITLFKNGRALLVDPGTYRYNGVPRWRKYFKGTRAHNTVTIDDQDQAPQETSFIWSHPYDARLTTYREKNGNLFYHAEHDGYTRLKAPVRHHRSVCIIDRDNFLIKDRFTGTGIHCFQINYHLHPRAIVAIDGRWWVIDHEGERVFMRLVEGDLQMVRGQDNPLMGWYSHCYGQKEPTCTLTYTRTGAVDRVVFTTAICTRIPLGRDHIDSRAGAFEGQTENS